MDFITSGGEANGALVLDDTTVFEDGATDLLVGGSGFDWFWIGVNDKIKGRADAEQVN